MIADKGCWERGCMAYDWRDGDGVEVAKREWVGLTDEERDECINGTAWVGEEKEVRVKIVEAIEAKLKEKNGV